jgi:small conductance mechanosensitive channel
VIKDFENRRIVIPNSVVNNETIINSTLSNEKICVFLEIGISFDSDVDRAMKIIEDEALKHPFLQDNRSYEETEHGLSKVVVKVINITETGIQLRGWVWASDPSSGFDMKCDLLKSIKHRFDQESISLAYPQRVIYIRENTQDKKQS